MEAEAVAALNNSNSSSSSSGSGRNGSAFLSVGNRRRVGSVNNANTATATATAANNNDDNSNSRGGEGRVGDQEIISWLQNRFDNLPLHQECYDQNATLEKMQNILKTHPKRYTAHGLDVLGINVLHVLACSHTDILYSDYDCTIGTQTESETKALTSSSTSPSLATKSLQRKKKQNRIEMMKYVMDINPSLPYMEDKVYHMTPLQLFLKCAGVQFFYHHHHHHSQHKQRYLSQSLKKGLSWNIIELILVLDPESKLELCRENENTSLVPFLQAASLSHCSLDVVYNLVRESVEILVSMTTGSKRRGRIKAVKNYTKRWNR